MSKSLPPRFEVPPPDTESLEPPSDSSPSGAESYVRPARPVIDLLLLLPCTGLCLIAAVPLMLEWAVTWVTVSVALAHETLALFAMAVLPGPLARRVASVLLPAAGSHGILEQLLAWGDPLARRLGVEANMRRVHVPLWRWMWGSMLGVPLLVLAWANQLVAMNCGLVVVTPVTVGRYLFGGCAALAAPSYLRPFVLWVLWRPVLVGPWTNALFYWDGEYPEYGNSARALPAVR